MSFGVFIVRATFAAFLFTALTRRLPHVSRKLWLGAFLTAILSLVARTLETGHAPMRNLYDFFLCMTAVFGPLSWLTKRRYGIDTTRCDALLALLICFPVAFIFDPAVHPLPPALRSPFFVPHVASYVLAYVLLTRATLFAFTPNNQTIKQSNNLQLAIDNRQSSILQSDNQTIKQSNNQTILQATFESVALGFAFLTLGLVLGSIWGHTCWGRYWAWDPKETGSLATWLVYASWFHLRLLNGGKATRLSKALLVIGLALIVITLLWINLSRLFPGLHNYATA